MVLVIVIERCMQGYFIVTDLRCINEQQDPSLSESATQSAMPFEPWLTNIL